MTAPEPLDPAKVMAEHDEYVAGYCGSEECHRVDEPWPCEPYRLAEALADEQEMRHANSRSARKLMDAIRSHPAFPADDVPLLFGERALLVIEAMVAENAALRGSVTLWQRLAARNARLNDALREKVQRARTWIINGVDPVAVGLSSKHEMLNELAAALAGEGAADQPQPVRGHASIACVDGDVPGEDCTCPPDMPANQYKVGCPQCEARQARMQVFVRGDRS